MELKRGRLVVAGWLPARDGDGSTQNLSHKAEPEPASESEEVYQFRYMLNSPKHILAKVKQARALWSPELLLTFQLVAHIRQASSQLQDENAKIEVSGRVKKRSHDPSDLCDLFVDA